LCFALGASGQIRFVKNEIQHDVSPPLRDLSRIAPGPPGGESREAEELRIIPLPQTIVVRDQCLCLYAGFALRRMRRWKFCTSTADYAIRNLYNHNDCDQLKSICRAGEHAGDTHRQMMRQVRSKDALLDA